MHRAGSLNLHQLEIFATVAREGSFTRAGDLLLRSESAISQEIKRLEVAVSARLIERAPRRPIRLTEAGRRMLAAWENVAQCLEGTLADLEALQRAEHGAMVLGAGAYFGSYLLPPIYAAFQRHAPGVKVHLTIANHANCIEAVRRRELDLAVVGGEVRNTGLAGIRLAGKDLVWIAPPSHRLASNANIPFELLTRERLLLPPNSSSTRKALDRRARESGLTLEASLELDGVEAQVTAVLSGLGIAAVPYHAMCCREGAALQVLRVQDFRLRLNWSVVWRAQELSPVASAFKDHLLAHTATIEALSLCPARGG